MNPMNNKNLKYLLIPLIIIAGSLGVKGQQKNRLHLDAMWEIAEENNILLENAKNRQFQSQKLKGTSWDLGMTKFQYANGEINAPVQDHYYSFEQELGNIFEMTATNKYWLKQNDLFGQMVNQTRKKIWKELAQQYYYWVWHC